MTITGKCLCGEIEFSVSGEIPKMYQCHCSLCRKVSGSSSNAALLIKAEGFRWIHGIDKISSYATKSGFKSDFCSNCGSPVPNPLKKGGGYWIPAGLLDDSKKLSVAAHVYVGSKANWDVVSEDCSHFNEMPDRKALKKIFRPGTED
ncbi:MAG: GFA family protein [bacterium]